MNIDQTTKLFDAINDTSITYIKSFVRTIDSPINISRSNLILDLSDSVIVPKKDDMYPLQISSKIETSETHAVGLVTNDTNYLSCEGAYHKFFVGQTHYLKLGVNFSDPNEAYTSIFRKVKELRGDLIIYDKPFGFTPRVYSSYDELIEASKMPEKVGPWGPVPGTYKRGLGTDHGIKIVRSPAENVTIINPKVQWPAGSKLYGSNAMMFSSSMNCRIVNGEVWNSCGSAMHFRWAEDCHFDGFKIFGEGRLNPWNQNSRVSEMISPAISLWGGNIGCSANRIHIDGHNHSFIVSEAGSFGVSVNDVNFKTTLTKSSSVRKAVIFGLYGSTKVAFQNISIDAPMGIPLYPGGIHGIDVANLRFVREQLPDWMHWGQSINIKGQLSWADKEFLPSEDIEFSFVADKDGYQIPYPEGIILSATIILESRDGIRGITCPIEVFKNNPSLELPIYQGAFQSKPGDTYELYRAGLSNHKLWIDRGIAIPIKVRCKIMRKR